jgi:uncharacterized protein
MMKTMMPVVLLSVAAHAHGPPIALPTTNGAAQAVPPLPPATIHVQGTAEIATTPDQVMIHMAVETSATDVLKAKADNDARTKAILALLAKERIAQKHIQTGDVSIQPQYDYERPVNGQPRMVGFVMRKSVVVCVVEMARFEELLNKLVIVGGNRLDRIEFRRSDLAKLEAMARVEAVKNAKVRATEMGAALQQRIGPPLHIVDSGSQAGPPVMYGRAEAMKADMSAGSEGGFAAGEMMVTANVTVTFAMGPGL